MRQKWIKPITLVFLAATTLSLIKGCCTPPEGSELTLEKWVWGEVNMAGEDPKFVDAEKSTVAVSGNGYLYVGTFDDGIWFKEPKSPHFKQVTNANQTDQGGAENQGNQKIKDSPDLWIIKLLPTRTGVVLFAESRRGLAVIENEKAMGTYKPGTFGWEVQARDLLLTKDNDGNDTLLLTQPGKPLIFLSLQDQAALNKNWNKSLTSSFGAKREPIDASFLLEGPHNEIFVIYNFFKGYLLPRDQIQNDGKADKIFQLPADLVTYTKIENKHSDFYFGHNNLMYLGLKVEVGKEETTGGLIVGDGKTWELPRTFGFSVNSAAVDGQNVWFFTTNGILKRENNSEILMNQDFFKDHPFQRDKNQSGFEGTWPAGDFYTAGAKAGNIWYILNLSDRKKIHTLSSISEKVKVAK